MLALKSDLVNVHECGVNVIVVYRELAEGQNGRDGTKEVQFLETHHLD